MPVKLRHPKARQHRITEAAVAAFSAGDVIGLHRALGLRPWVPSPLEVVEGEAPPWPPGSGGAMAWPLAVELQRELLALGAVMPTRASSSARRLMPSR